MTQKEIQEGNKLIAEFMGVKIGIDLYSWRIGCTEPLKESHLNYHGSYDWLMPVVEKINSISLPPFTIDFSISKNNSGWIAWHPKIPGDLNQDRFYCSTDNDNASILSTFKAIVEFIKWHNTLKKQ